MLNMHHIVSDGWSIGVLLHELRAILSCVRGGAACRIALPAGSVRRLQRVAAPVAGRGRRFSTSSLATGRQKLAGFPESLDLATDFPRPSVQTFTGATHAFALDADLTARLQRLAEQPGGTLYMVLLAAFKTLLYRYTGQDDLCVGTPIANRQYGETEGSDRDVRQYPAVANPS